MIFATYILYVYMCCLCVYAILQSNASELLCYSIHSKPSRTDAMLRHASPTNLCPCCKYRRKAVDARVCDACAGAGCPRHGACRVPRTGSNSSRW